MGNRRRGIHRLDDLLGKEVFDQDTGEKLASVEEAIFDDEARRVVALLAGGGLLRSPRVVRWGSVGNFADVVAVREDGALGDLSSDPEVSALRRRCGEVEGKEIVTEGGEKVGEVTEPFRRRLRGGARLRGRWRCWSLRGTWDAASDRRSSPSVRGASRRSKSGPVTGCLRRASVETGGERWATRNCR